MMNVIIGTAGHVDHGKTALIKALTDIDADRLPEEKKRGITIDLGFAYIDLPNAGLTGIVDVPGHEKFVRNMLAGAGGVDVALLVIAADEGIMPQTMEHADILSLLGVKSALIAVSKSDKVSQEKLNETVKGIREYFKDSLWENASIIPYSVYDKDSLSKIKAELDRLCSDIHIEKNSSDSFYMPIDRKFSVNGIGTVVTGTIKEGSINRQGSYYLYPSLTKVAIRSIQVHSKDCEEAHRGQRCAVAVSNLKPDEIHRGDVLGTAGAYMPTYMLDCMISILDRANSVIRSGTKVNVYLGSAELRAKVILIGCDEIAPGKSAYAQLRFDEETVAQKDDVFVIRSINPVATVGGGYVIDPFPSKKKKNKNTSKVLQSFRIKESGTDKEKAYEFVDSHVHNLLRADALDMELQQGIQELILGGKVLRIDKYLVSKERVEKIASYLENQLDEYHRNNPQMPGVLTATAASYIFGNSYRNASKVLLSYFADNRLIKIENGYVSLYEFEAKIPKELTEIRKRIFEIYSDAGLNPPAYNDVRDMFLNSKEAVFVINEMVKNKELVRLDGRYLIACQYLDIAKDKLEKYALHSEEGRIVLSEYRDRIKSSRKMALSLLEYFDREGITKCDGDVRFMRFLETHK